MDLAALERSVRASSAGAIVVDPRLVRRVIKSDRNLPGLGLQVPHGRCYALRREALLPIVTPAELGETAASMPPDVILLPRPTPSETAGRTTAEILTRFWRASFHAQVHIELEKRIASGALPRAAIVERIDRIGQTEFDEVRAILRRDDVLLPPYDDREAFIEFVALYLELRRFAPALVAPTFPGLPIDRVDAILGSEIDPLPLLERCCPVGADRSRTVVRDPKGTTTPTFSAPASAGFPQIFEPRVLGPSAQRRLSVKADKAMARGNVVRAVLMRAEVARASGGEASAGYSAMRADLEKLGARLNAALRTTSGQEVLPALTWTAQLFIVAEQAAARRGLRYPIEARLLHDLQNAAVASEQPEQAVDLVTWALSFGKRPVVRPLPAAREIRIARYFRSAAKRVRHIRIPNVERKLLARLLQRATAIAEENVRAALRPRILRTVTAVGLTPLDLPEQVARDKVVEELLDHAVERGFLGLGHLRDALSRNQLKLDNLDASTELLSGDALLRANEQLAVALDGVYRPGEIYLRLLQKLSSIASGTRIGRFLTLYLILPVAGAFVLLEGLAHLVVPVLSALGYGQIRFLSLTSFAITTAVLFALIHSRAIRSVALRGLRILGTVLATIFLRIPRWILTRPTVLNVLTSRGVRIALRRVVVPMGIAAAIYFATPLSQLSQSIGLPIAFVVFVAASWAFTSRVGLLVEEVVFDWLAPTWRTLSHQVLPGLFRLVVDTFRVWMELLERVIYRVDEWLRFRAGQHGVTLVAKAVIGVVWFAIAYIVRLYITLLIEPEINPVKHFPVVTVAHKLFIPFAPELLTAIQKPLSALGSVIGGTIAGTTVFLLPSVCGFLVWELKENWKLYRASRAPTLESVAIGHHGETMAALMIPGFHSGTLPKLYDRLRRAAQREDEAALGALGEAPRGTGSSLKGEGSLGQFREGIEDVEKAVRRFVERELVGLLRIEPRWTFGPLEVVHVELGPNRVRIKVSCTRLSPDPCEIAFEEQSGFIVASIPGGGFIDALPPSPHAGRILLENALAGLYQRAGVDLVREKIEWALGGNTPYDISDEGLLVWPARDYRIEVIYPLARARRASMIHPIVRGGRPERSPQPIDSRRVLFRYESIAWASWVYAWSRATEGDAAIPRLVQGGSILPEPTRLQRVAS